MKINKNRSRSPRILKIIIPIVAIVVAAGIYTGVAYGFKLWPFRAATNSPQTHQTNNSSSQTPNKGTSKDDITVPDAASQKTTDQIPVSTTLAATITTLSETNNQINFAGTVNSTDKDGQCTVTFSNPNDKSVSPALTPTITANATTCGPIHISADEFSYLGDWTVTFRYYADNYNTQAVATGNITIQ